MLRLSSLNSSSYAERIALYAKQSDVFMQFASRYSKERLEAVMQLLDQSGVLEKCTHGEEVSYLLKDLAPDDEKYYPPNEYPLEKLKSNLAFINKHQLLANCRNGWYVRELLRLLRHDHPAMKDERLPKNQVDLVYLAMTHSPTESDRFTAHIENCFQNAKAGEKILNTLNEYFGNSHPAALKYYQLRVQAIIDELLNELKPHYSVGISLSDDWCQTIEQWLNSLNRDSVFQCELILKRLRILISQSPVTIRTIMPWFIQDKIWEKFANDSEFFDLIYMIGRLDNENCSEIVAFVQSTGIIQRCTKAAEIWVIMECLRKQPYHVIKNIKDWFKASNIMSRCHNMDDVIVVVKNLVSFIDKGAEVTANGITGVQKPKLSSNAFSSFSNADKNNEWIFYQVEENYRKHGQDWLYTSEFGNFFAEFYDEKKIEDAQKYLFTTFPVSQHKAPHHAGVYNAAPVTIVYNNSHFGQTDGQFRFRMQDRLIQGSSLNKIGYNICLPQGKQIQAVMIEVYGGSGRLCDAYLPGQLGEDEIALLNRGIATITLNLPDLIELKQFQADMPEELNAKIQECIHEFYRVLVDNPEQLHHELACLRNKPIYLFGASFGGRTVLQHAQLYPKTFSGYISHNGAINSYPAHLTAGENIVNMADSDRVLLIHCADDNCVNLKESLYWYQKAEASRKKVQLGLFDNGCPFPKKGGPNRCRFDETSRDDDIYKGHFRPTHSVDLERYVTTIYLFMTGTISTNKNVNDWRYHKYSIYAGSGNRFSTDDNKFLSIAFQHYKHHGHAASEAIVLWDQYYQHLYRAHAAIQHMIADNRMADFMSSLQLTDEIIDRAISATWLPFIHYILETEPGLSSLHFDTARLQRSLAMMIHPSLRDKFRDLINNDNTNTVFFFKSICLGNPDLITDAVFTPKPEDVTAMKSKFLEAIDTDAALIRAARKEHLMNAARLLK